MNFIGAANYLSNNYFHRFCSKNDKTILSEETNQSVRWQDKVVTLLKDVATGVSYLTVIVPIIAGLAWLLLQGLGRCLRGDKKTVGELPCRPSNPSATKTAKLNPPSDHDVKSALLVRAVDCLLSANTEDHEQGYKNINGLLETGLNLPDLKDLANLWIGYAHFFGRGTDKNLEEAKKYITQERVEKNPAFNYLQACLAISNIIQRTDLYENIENCCNEIIRNFEILGDNSEFAKLHLNCDFFIQIEIACQSIINKFDPGRISKEVVTLLLKCRETSTKIFGSELYLKSFYTKALKFYSEKSYDQAIELFLAEMNIGGFSNNLDKHYHLSRYVYSKCLEMLGIKSTPYLDSRTEVAKLEFGEFPANVAYNDYHYFIDHILSALYECAFAEWLKCNGNDDAILPYLDKSLNAYKDPKMIQLESLLILQGTVKKIRPKHYYEYDKTQNAGNNQLAIYDKSHEILIDHYDFISSTIKEKGFFVLDNLINHYKANQTEDTTTLSKIGELESLKQIISFFHEALKTPIQPVQ